MEQLYHSRTPCCCSYPRAFLGSALFPSTVSVLLCLRGGISGGYLPPPFRFGPCAHKSGSVCHVVIIGMESPAFVQTLDVCEKTDGFIQAQMKDDKQADALAEGTSVRIHSRNSGSKFLIYNAG